MIIPIIARQPAKVQKKKGRRSKAQGTGARSTVKAFDFIPDCAILIREKHSFWEGILCPEVKKYSEYLALWKS